MANEIDYQNVRDRIAALREAVTNILRHAKATRCQVSVRQEGGQIICHISDDGSVETVGQLPETRRCCCASQRAIAGEMVLGPIGELTAEFLVLAEFLEQARRTLVVVKPNRVVFEPFKGALSIPREEMEFAGWVATASSIPV